MAQKTKKLYEMNLVELSMVRLQIDQRIRDLRCQAVMAKLASLRSKDGLIRRFEQQLANSVRTRRIDVIDDSLEMLETLLNIEL